MYGLINNAMQDMVVTRFGEDQWQAIHRHSGVGEERFLSMRSYDDATTYELVAAASDILSTPVDDCLEMFGQWWVAEVATKSFAPLMETTGRSTIDFLNNLNLLHDRIASTFTNYVPPEFQVEDIDATNGRYRVHYRSRRDGLTAFVVGLIRGLATHFRDRLEIIGIDIHPQAPGTHSIFDVAVERADA
jgi:hypothetical protein